MPGGNPWITVLDYLGNTSRDGDPASAIISTNHLTHGRPADERSELAQLGVMVPGQKLVSRRGTYEARFRADGDLTIVRVVDEHVLWTSRTRGIGASQAVLQDDGNFVVGVGARPVGASMTGGSGATRLCMRDDGSLCLYRGDGHDTVWTSRTSEWHN